MSRAPQRLGAALLVLMGLTALLAPWLGLRDPDAQPDGLVLRDLPPLGSATTIRLADGSRRFVHEAREEPDGRVSWRRGQLRGRYEPDELAGSWRGRELFPLGTDSFGRDLTSRLIHGARISLLIGFAAAALAIGIGGLIGLVAGLAGGWVDATLMRLVDLVIAVPRLFLALLLVSLWGASLTTTVVVLGATTWMAAARLVRGQVLSLRDRDFVIAARAGGVAPVRLGLHHLLPSAIAPLVVEGTLRVGDSILLEAALSFLGLGVPPPTPSWGNLVADGRDSLLQSWWIATLPGVAIALTVIALHLVGDGIRDRLSGRRALS